MNVSVIVPVWNRSDLTAAFLVRNWQLYRDKPTIEFIIVNNGSIDNTDKILEIWKDRMKDRLQVVTSKKNLGFSGGNNLGVQHSKADILIFTSNDVTPVGDYAVLVVKNVMKYGANVLYGAKLLKHNTGWNKFNDKLIPYLAGHFIAVQHGTWQDFLTWDEQYYPTDYEDIDLSMQATEKGLDLLALDLPIQHAFGQTASITPEGEKRLVATNRNRQKFMKKWGLTE